MYAVEYQKPKSLADAAALLAKTGGKPLAGGQSLVAAMKLRLAQPGTLVDLAGISELTGIRKEFGDFTALKGVSLEVRAGERRVVLAE